MFEEDRYSFELGPGELMRDPEERYLAIITQLKFIERLIATNEKFLTLNDIREFFHKDKIRAELEMSYGLDWDSLPIEYDIKRSSYGTDTVTIHGVHDLRHYLEVTHD